MATPPSQGAIPQGEDVLVPLQVVHPEPNQAQDQCDESGSGLGASLDDMFGLLQEVCEMPTDLLTQLATPQMKKRRFAPKKSSFKSVAPIIGTTKAGTCKKKASAGATKTVHATSDSHTPSIEESSQKPPAKGSRDCVAPNSLDDDFDSLRTLDLNSNKFKQVAVKAKDTLRAILINEDDDAPLRPTKGALRG